jgi:branched-chain amino acid transport system substrate-binding protein
LRQFGERGMQNAGIKLIGPGDITDDNGLNAMGDARGLQARAFGYPRS